ncbi:MAG: T9SS type A sorting domain-containing protein, partial [Calditrichota bacterium]
TTVQNRSNYIACMWKKVEYADIYRVQISRLLTFSPLAASGTTSDTVRTLSGLVEGQKYYWRVRAENIAGPGPWSDTLDFTIIVAPTDLALEISGPNEITLNWTDNSAVEDGYVIERKQSPDTIYTVLDTLKGSGNEYTDTNLEQGLTYTYRVKAYKDSAESDYSNEASLILVGIKEQQNEIPTKYSIDQNYPNPFNPTTKIKFALPKSAPTKIIIYDLLGREIQTLINKELEAGYHDIDLDASNLTSGIYFYRIQSGEFVSTKKMMLMK